jgi:hypothetical protein
MKKKPSTLYFEKRYCLLVHSVVLQQRLAVTAFSSNSAEQEIIDRSCSYNVNQIVYINCIDLITEGVTSPDASVRPHSFRLNSTSRPSALGNTRRAPLPLPSSK